jgi:aldose 1-epimerase
VASSAPPQPSLTDKLAHSFDWVGKKKEKTVPHVTRADFGKTADGRSVDIYSLTNGNGLVAKIMTYGATLTELHTPDRFGKFGDIVLGFDNLADYETKSPFFGATTGRVANRIAKGEFELDGETYQLAINNGPNTLHGGKIGFDKKVWDAKVVKGHEGVAVAFHYVSPDMEENFPGTLDVTVTYTLTEKDELRIDYKATTDKATIVNLTNHSYWNLSAFKLPTILNEVAYINADKFTVVDETSIPTGRLQPVIGTPFDFLAPTVIGSRISEISGEKVGYDHNYVLNGAPGALKLAARVTEPESGRSLEVETTEPGVQFYTGNYLDGSVTGIGGHKYVQYAGFCLETQHFPDSIHHPEFPSTVLKPGEVYTQTTIHKFSIK